MVVLLIGSFGLALGLTLVLTPAVRRFAIRSGALDHPTHRKGVSRRVVPRLGGVAIFAGCWGSAAFVLTWTDPGGFTAELPLLLGAGLGGLAMLLVGIADDYHGASAYKKAAVQVPVAAILLLTTGSLFDQVAIPYGPNIAPGILAFPITFLWIVGITNAINLIDGVDGLASGTSLVSAGVLCVIAAMQGNVPLAILAAALCGACMGFLRYNYSPARIFLGDSGSLSVGFMLAVLALDIDTQRPAGSSLVIPIAILGYPILDTFLVMGRRFCVGKSMFAGDQRHIHHHLLARGLTHAQASLALYGLTMLFGAVAIAWALDVRPASLAALGVLVITMILGGRTLGYHKVLSPARFARLRHDRRRYGQLAARTKRTIQAIRSASAVTEMVQTLEQVSATYGLVDLRLFPDAETSQGGGQPWQIVVQPAAASGMARTRPPSGAVVEEKLVFGTMSMVAHLKLDVTGIDEKLQLERRAELAQIVHSLAKRVSGGLREERVLVEAGDKLRQ